MERVDVRVDHLLRRVGRDLVPAGVQRRTRLVRHGGPLRRAADVVARVRDRQHCRGLVQILDDLIVDLRDRRVGELTRFGIRQRRERHRHGAVRRHELQVQHRAQELRFGDVAVLPVRIDPVRRNPVDVAEQDVGARHAGEPPLPPLAPVGADRIVGAVREDVAAVELTVDRAVVGEPVVADDLEPVGELGVDAVQRQDGVVLLRPEDLVRDRGRGRDVQELVRRLTRHERHRQDERAKDDCSSIHRRCMEA